MRQRRRARENYFGVSEGIFWGLAGEKSGRYELIGEKGEFGEGLLLGS